MQSFCTSFSFTQSIESLLFIENVLQHDSSECGGTVVRVRKPKWIAIVCASIAAHLKYFIKRSLAAICCPFMRMRCQVFALRAIAYEMRTLAESQIFFISCVHSYNGFIKKIIPRVTCDNTIRLSDREYSVENVSTCAHRTCCATYIHVRVSSHVNSQAIDFIHAFSMAFPE